MSETSSEVGYGDAYTNEYGKENRTGASENGALHPGSKLDSPDFRKTAQQRTTEIEEQQEDGEVQGAGIPRRVSSLRHLGVTHSRNLSSESQVASPETYAEGRERQWHRTKSGLGKEETDQSSRKIPVKQSIDYGTEWLDLSRNAIEEKHTKLMARALETGKLQNVKTLFLQDNAGDFGMRAMLNAMQGNHLKQLENLILWNCSSYDEITAFEKGTDAIADAIAMRKMPKLERLDVTSSLHKLIPPRPWATVFQDLANGSLGQGRLNRYKHLFFGCFSIENPYTSSLTLECLNCRICKMNIYSGDEGLKKIVLALNKSRPPLKFLHLRENYIGFKGVKYLSWMLRSGALPDLEEVNVHNNQVGVDGAREIIRAYLENPLLTAKVMLDWPDPILKLRASAFREKNILLERRLEELKTDGVKMEHGNVSKAYKWRPKFSMVRSSTSKSYRFCLLCQHPNHQQNPPRPSHSGIAIRMKSLFASRPTKLVDTEYNWKSTKETEIVRSGELTDADVPVPLSLPEREETLRMNVLAVTSVILRIQPHPTAGTTQNMVGTVEEGHMYITARSRSFIQMLKSLSQNCQEPTSWMDKVKSKVSYAFQNRRKNRKQVAAMILELLMVADHKPSKFHEMFGLNRVLLRAQDLDGHHYPAYVCDSCKNDPEDGAVAVIHELVADTNLQLSHSGQPSRSESEPDWTIDLEGSLSRFTPEYR
ncbi:hypothetical protein R1flu_014713 [Riccia fluitans]|uniref:Uncharacterized protein n=1 Tax=Riccia fluitans TaxID=41844 RepID=A0ABD1YK02_9MARC